MEEDYDGERNAGPVTFYFSSTIAPRGRFDVSWPKFTGMAKFSQAQNVVKPNEDANEAVIY